MQVSADCHDCLGYADIWPVSCVIKRRTVRVIHYRNPSRLVYPRRPECFECLSLSQIETVIRASKQLEQLLAQHYGATGRGLHEKTSSVEDQLDSDTVRRLRKIATLRNKVVHEDFEIDDLTDFQCEAQGLAQQLQPKSVLNTSKTKNSTPKSNQTPNSAAQPKPDTRPAVKKPSTTESAKQPDHTAPRQPTKASPTRTLTPQPRVQPRVKLASKNQPTPSRNTQPATTQPQSSSRLPTISGILIFLAIIWILAH